MDCKKSNELMMKYMDNTISKKEASELHNHLSVCADCMADFQIYDEMMNGFSDIELIEPPDGFEDAVFAKIDESGVTYTPKNNLAENIFTAIIGVVSIIFGVGFLFVSNREAIMNYLLNSEMFGSYAEIMNPMINIINEYTTNFIAVSTDFITSVSYYASTYKYWILGAFVLLLGFQYILRRKEVKDKVEE